MTGREMKTQAEKDYQRGGIITRRLEALEARCEKLEQALIVVAGWVETGEWTGCKAYINAILETEKAPT